MDALLHALQPLFAPAFTLWAAPFTWLELVAFVLAVAMVVCNIRVNPLGWPLAIISSLLYFALFWNSRLYGDAGLQIFFVVVAGWGWWQWLRGTLADGSALPVRLLPTRLRWRLLAALAVAWPATGWFLAHYTDTDVPWWDAFPTAASVIGQVAARPQVCGELARVDRGQRGQRGPVRLQGPVAHGEPLCSVHRHVGGRVANLAARARGGLTGFV